MVVAVVALKKITFTKYWHFTAEAMALPFKAIKGDTALYNNKGGHGTAPHSKKNECHCLTQQEEAIALPLTGRKSAIALHCNNVGHGTGLRSENGSATALYTSK